MNPKIIDNRPKKFIAIIIVLILVLFSCKQALIRDDFYLLKYRFDEISNLSLDTVYREMDTVFLAYTDHSGYYDPYSIDEQFMYLLMINEDCLQENFIAYTIKVEGSSAIEPATIEGHCSYEQICSTPAYKAYTKSSFYRLVLQRLYRSKYYPYHFLLLNWNYGYELSYIKDPSKFYNANSTELIRNFIVNTSHGDPMIDSIWYNVLEKEMKINSVDPKFDKEKKELLISITNYRRRANL